MLCEESGEALLTVDFGIIQKLKMKKNFITVLNFCVRFVIAVKWNRFSRVRWPQVTVGDENFCKKRKKLLKTFHRNIERRFLGSNYLIKSFHARVNVNASKLTMRKFRSSCSKLILQMSSQIEIGQLGFDSQDVHLFHQMNQVGKWNIQSFFLISDSQIIDLHFLFT